MVLMACFLMLIVVLVVVFTLIMVLFMVGMGVLSAYGWAEFSIPEYGLWFYTCFLAFIDLPSLYAFAPYAM